MKYEFTIFQSDADGQADKVGCATLDLASLGTDEFHGELPLEVDERPTGGVLMLKAKIGDEYPPEQDSELIVSIDNPKRKALGLNVDNMDPTKLFLIGVKKGTSMDGLAMLENQVAAGCFIVGVTGDDACSASESQAMDKILKHNPEQVDLVCRRAKKFRIPVTLPEEGDMGLEVRQRELGNSLLITNIYANGAVEAWNADNPEQIVKPWDHIVAVNGESGNAAHLEKLVKEAKKPANVVLTIVRIASEVA